GCCRTKVKLGEWASPSHSDPSQKRTSNSRGRKPAKRSSNSRRDKPTASVGSSVLIGIMIPLLGSVKSKGSGRPTRRSFQHAHQLFEFPTAYPRQRQPPSATWRPNPEPADPRGGQYLINHPPSESDPKQHGAPQPGNEQDTGGIPEGGHEQPAG